MSNTSLHAGLGKGRMRVSAEEIIHHTYGPSLRPNQAAVVFGLGCGPLEWFAFSSADVSECLRTQGGAQARDTRLC